MNAEALAAVRAQAGVNERREALARLAAFTHVLQEVRDRRGTQDDWRAFAAEAIRTRTEVAEAVERAISPAEAVLFEAHGTAPMRGWDAVCPGHIGEHNALKTYFNELMERLAAVVRQADRELRG